jgi:hypothetical protein
MIAILCLAAISLLLALVVSQIRHNRGRATLAAQARGFAKAPVAPTVTNPLTPAVSLWAEPVASPVEPRLAEMALAGGEPGPLATNRTTAAIGIPKPAFPPAAAPEPAARKVISIVHDFGHPRDYPTDQRRYLTTREAFEILAEIRACPPECPIDIVLHTPGGEAFACELIASAIKDRPNTTAYVPYCAMSAGTIVALACEKIVMGKYACLGPIDTQFYGFPIESYIRLAKEKPLAAIADETVLLCYLAEKEMKTARARACELLNKAHFGRDDACQLTDFLVKGDMPHSEQISRPRALEIGVNVVGGDCPAGVYDMVEQRLRIYQPYGDSDGFGPDYQVRATMIGNRQPPAAAARLPRRESVRPETVFYAPDEREVGGPSGLAKLANEEILRRVVNAACAFVTKKIAEHAPSKTEVRAMEAEIREYLKTSFDKFAAFIDAHWAEIFQKIVAVFPD